MSKICFLLFVSVVFTACECEPQAKQGCPPGKSKCAAGCCKACNSHGECPEQGIFCCDGLCQDTCNSCGVDETYCDTQNSCHNLAADYWHCGECAISCPDTLGVTVNRCLAGRCLCGDYNRACSDGFVCCPRETCPDANPDCADCIDTKVSHDNCGECGNNCGPNRVCVNGGCVDDSINVCAPDTKCEVDGDVECADLQSNINHCGSCDNRCADSFGNRVDSCAGSTCVCSSEGTGTAPCPSGQQCLTVGCAVASCDSTSCALGCCQGNQCHNPGVRNCGAAGSTCTDCGALDNRADACSTDGQCVCNATGSLCAVGKICTATGCEVSTCDASSCPSGCCHLQECTPPSFSECGTGGANCGDCSDYGERADICGTGGDCSCEAATQLCPVGQRCTSTGCETFCDATNCAAGCCSGTSCVANSMLSCGTAGAACVNCGELAGSGRADICTAGGDCICDAAQQLCGQGETCTSSGCASPTCSNSNCPNGCCRGTSCLNNSMLSCGLNGDTCVDCATLAGAGRADACNASGDCICSAAGRLCDSGEICGGTGCAAQTCNASSCALGCCSATGCLANSMLSCGIGGDDCVDCAALATAGRADSCDAAGDCICSAAGQLCELGQSCEATGCTDQCDIAHCSLVENRYSLESVIGCTCGDVTAEDLAIPGTLTEGPCTNYNYREWDGTCGVNNQDCLLGETVMQGWNCAGACPQGRHCECPGLEAGVGAGCAVDCDELFCNQAENRYHMIDVIGCTCDDVNPGDLAIPGGTTQGPCSHYNYTEWNGACGTSDQDCTQGEVQQGWSCAGACGAERHCECAGATAGSQASCELNTCDQAYCSQTENRYQMQSVIGCTCSDVGAGDLAIPGSTTVGPCSNYNYTEWNGSCGASDQDCLQGSQQQGWSCAGGCSADRHCECAGATSGQEAGCQLNPCDTAFCSQTANRYNLVGSATACTCSDVSPGDLAIPGTSTVAPCSRYNYTEWNGTCGATPQTCLHGSVTSGWNCAGGCSAGWHCSCVGTVGSCQPD